MGSNTLASVMIDVFPEILLAAVAFTSTNLDDLFLLSSLFVDIEFNDRSIIIGQFLGMSFLALVSVLAALFALVIPDGWFASLGVAPLYLGPGSFPRSDQKFYCRKVGCQDE
jgi:cadmium resistance protein CadD (predicted permease)